MMLQKSPLWCCFFTISLFLCSPLQATSSTDSNQEVVDLLSDKAQQLVQKNLVSAEQEVIAQNWYRALSLVNQIIESQNAVTINAETLKRAYYLKALSLDALKEYERANSALDIYLQYTVSSDEEQWSWEKKLDYGKHFARGGRVRFLGLSFAPRLFTDEDLAHEILDSISTASANRSILRQATLEKALLYRKQRQYPLCNAQLNELITMEPNSEEGFQAFTELARSFMMEMSGHSRTEDLITYAQINRNRFAQHYPQANYEQMDQWIAQMKEEMALSLLEIATLYKKRGNQTASLYYQERVKKQFSDTNVVQKTFASTNGKAS